MAIEGRFRSLGSIFRLAQLGLTSWAVPHKKPKYFKNPPLL